METLFSSAAASVAVAAGVATAVGVVRVVRELSPRGGGAVVNGPWRARMGDGGPGMTPLRRAVVAVTGLWAMDSTAAVYFTATTDSAGRRLDGGAEYRVTGTNPDARWWSVTAYRNLQFLPNGGRRYCFSKGSVSRNANGRWAIRLGPVPREGDWLPTRTGGVMTLTLRLYGPGAAVLADPAGVPLPCIDRLTPGAADV